MPSLILSTSRDSGLLAELKRSGFSLLRGLAPHLSTIEVAKTLGTVVSVEELLPSSGIPTVQSLRPRPTSEVGQNQYSGHYGLGTFPLHSDLAHWAIPPRYLLLRCVVGSDDVFTHLLPWTPIVDLVGAATLRKAVFAARRRRIGYSSLVRAMSHNDGIAVLRWDPIFLAPLNRHAHALASAMLDSGWDTKVMKILLSQPGDTLIIHNWTMLHGRGEVSQHSTARHIDRVYLSEVLQ
jgi:L-asparagine oxygenase